MTSAHLDPSLGEIEAASEQLQIITQDILREQVPQQKHVARGLLEVTAALAQSLSTDPNPVAAEVLVSATLSIGDVTSWGLVEDEPRTVQASGGTSSDSCGAVLFWTFAWIFTRIVLGPSAGTSHICKCTHSDPEVAVESFRTVRRGGSWHHADVSLARERIRCAPSRIWTLHCRLLCVMKRS